MRAPPLLRLTVPFAVAALALEGVPSCETYTPPPTATIVGLTNGILKDPLAPIGVQFSVPVDPGSVRIEIAPFDIDAFGNLPDEVKPPGALNALATYATGSRSHLSAAWSADDMTLTLTPTPAEWLPTGPSLVLLVEPGLTASSGGTVLHYRQRIPFSYPAVCGASKPTKFRSGAYFFILEVNKPFGVPLKVFAAIDVNPETGAFFGQFTAALRNSDPSRCSPPCTSSAVCETIPTEACVEMSQPPVSVYEWPDFVPKATAPNGYTFEMHGCATDVGDAGAVNILTAPGVLNVTSPDVSIEGLTFTAQFAPVDGGLVEGSGSLTATKTYLTTNNLGPGAGTLSALSIPDAQAPKDLPQPGTMADAGVEDAEPAGSGDAGEAD